MTQIVKFDKPVRVKTQVVCYYGNRICNIGETFFLKAGDVLGSYMEVVNVNDGDDNTDVNADGDISELEVLSVKQLKALAEAEGIDLAKSSNKAEIIEVITAARAAKPAEEKPAVEVPAAPENDPLS